MRPQYIQRAFTALALIASLSFAACKSDTPTPQPQPVFPKPDVNPKATPYVTRVLEYMPAVGQFTNTLPEYEAGDTQEDMNRKALEYLKDNQRSLVTLGGWGGYIVVGFDHTILNVPGKRDFRVLGNAFFGNDNKEAYEGGSCEPGVIMSPTMRTAMAAPTKTNGTRSRGAPTSTTPRSLGTPSSRRRSLVQTSTSTATSR